MEAKVLDQVYDSLSSNPTKKIIGNQQHDDDFLDDIFDIAQHSQTVRKQFFGRRSQLTQEEYQFVQKTGQIHYKCASFNQTQLMLPEQIPKEVKCKCGCNKAYGKSLPFCIDEQQATFIGPGVILFFFYTKMMSLLVLMTIIVFGIYALVTNIAVGNHHSDCSKPGALPFLCEVKIITSLQNKDNRDDLLLGQLILGMIACFIWSLMIRVIRALGRRKNRIIDDYLDSSADFCILLDGLPEGDYSEKQILEFIQKKWNDCDQLNKFPIKIRGVQVIYKMHKVRKMIEMIHDMSRDIVKIVDKQENQGEKRYIIKDGELDQYKFKKQQILLLYSKLKNFRNKFWDDSEFRQWLSAGVVLVQFEQPGQQQQFLQYYGSHKKTVLKQIIRSIKSKYFSKITQKFQGYNITMVKAPEPSDIFWDHCEQRVKKQNIMWVWIINLILMALSFGAQLIVRQIKLAYPQISEIGIVSIFTLNFFNRFIWNVLLTIVFIEKNHTKTDNITSVMNKSYISQVMNIILIPILLNLVLANNLDGPSGLAGAIHDYQITAFFFMMIFNFVNFPHLILIVIRNIKCLRRAVIRFYCRVTGQLDTYDQMRDALTFLYTPPNPPLAGFYVYITTVISQAAFFCHLMPVILYYLLGSILLFHMINRYIVLKRCKIPDLIDFVVFETCCGFAMNVPLLYAIGTILFLILRDHNFGGQYYIPSIMCIIIWLLSTQSPFGFYQKMTDCILNCCFAEQKPAEQQKLVGFNLIDRIMKIAKKESQKKQKAVTKRKQNYHANCTTTLIFNMQNQLKEVAGQYHNKSKQFCHRFTLNIDNQPDYRHKKSTEYFEIESQQKILTSRKQPFRHEFNSGQKLLNQDSIQLQKIKIDTTNMKLNEHQGEQMVEDQFRDPADIFKTHDKIFSGIFGKMDIGQKK